jgi:hypothetical protein
MKLRAGLIERGFDATLDAALIGFALFTVLFHVALPFDLRADLVTAIWAVATVAIVVVDRRRFAPTGADLGRDDDGTSDTRIAGRPLLVLGGAGLVAAVASGVATLNEPGWWFFWGGVIAILVPAVVSVVRARSVPALPRVTSGAVFVLAAALLCALASVLTVVPDVDDPFLVNRSVAIEHGKGQPFPERDTLFSDELFAVERPENPPAAIEPFVGTIARALPVPAPTVAYLLLAPLVSALAVAAIWRLLRVLRAPNAALAAVCAAGFLALDGDVARTFGKDALNAWQGKVILLLLVIPLTWRHAVAWGRDGDRRALVLLVACGIAGVGLSSTAVFVLPAIMVAGVGAAALADRRHRSRLVGALAAVVYPLAVGLFAIFATRQSGAVETVRLTAAGGAPAQPGGFRFFGGFRPTDVWHLVIGSGMTMAITAGAVLLAWLATRDRVARLVLLLAPLLLFGVFFFPGVLDALADARGGAESVSWRVVWVIPVPAAVGLVVTAPFLLAKSRKRLVASVALPVGVAVALLAFGSPVWSTGKAVTLSRPAWDVQPQMLAAARRLVELSEPGDTVAAPVPVGGALAIISSTIRAVNPRQAYMTGRHAVEEFHAPERIFVSASVGRGLGPRNTGRFIAALDLLGVDTACTSRPLDGSAVTVALREAGFEPRGADRACTFWRRSGRARDA